MEILNVLFLFFSLPFFPFSFFLATGLFSPVLAGPKFLGRILGKAPPPFFPFFLLLLGGTVHGEVGKKEFYEFLSPRKNIGNNRTKRAE